MPDTGSIPRAVPFAFLLGVAIWSTTPLGIVWSSETIHPTMAVLLRMTIGWLLGVILLTVMRIRLPLYRAALTLYGYSTIGLVGGMLLSYFAARYLASGTMSLIFGLAPIISGLLARRILDEPGFNRRQITGFLVAFIGLGIVCADKMTRGQHIGLGIMLMLGAVFLFSLSAVLVKTVRVNIHPLATTVGSLGMSLPVFFAAWLIFDGTVPVQHWSDKSITAVIYLGIFGSLIASVAYFYILKYLKASTVTLVTLITPAFAILLGGWLNHEPLNWQLALGAALVLAGLLLYHNASHRWMKAAK